MSHSIRPAMNRSNLHVLVIDDDDIAREFICDILRRSGFTTEDEASTLGVTNRLIREHFHVVVLDVMMPALSGDKLTVLLRKNQQLQHLGIVLVSSAPKEELEALAKEHGADAVVSKEEARDRLATAVLHAARVRSSVPGDPGKR
jgi:CheY-like chemotaxis protein